MSDLDPSTLNKLKVVDLREHLSSRGLPTAGLKAELVKRLQTALLSEEQDAGNSDDSQTLDDTDVESEDNLQEDEDRLRAEEESQLRAAEEARLRAEEEAQIRAAEETRLRAEEEARLRAEEEARLRAEEEARLRAEEEAQLRAEQARLKAEEEARLRAEEEARLRAEEEARLRAEREAQLRAEEEARLRAEREAQLRAEEEARLRAEEKARLRAEEKARLKAEEEARLRAEREAKLKAEEEARLRAERAARLRAEEEARLRAEEAARLRAEEEAQLRAERAARLRAEEEAQLRAQEEARLIAERELQLKNEEAKKKKEEEDRRITNEKREAEKKLIEEEKAREEQRKLDEEMMRKEQERWLVEEQMRQAQEDHKRRLKVEEDNRKLEIEKKKIMQQKLIEEQKRKSDQEKNLKQSEYNTTQIPADNDHLSQNEHVSFSTAVTSHSTTLQMPPVPPFSAMPSVNIMPPPPTILMSNVPPLLPPGTSMPPTMHNITASIFPPPLPQLNMMNPQEDSGLSSLQQNNLDFEGVGEAMDTNENSSEIKLPQALEKVLALKSERAQLLGVDPDSVLQTLPANEDKTISSNKPPMVTLVSVDEDEYGDDDSSARRKESKNKKRKKKKKKRQSKNSSTTVSSKQSERWGQKESAIDVDIDYVQEVMDISDPLYLQFMNIFEKFKLTESEKENEGSAADNMKDAIKEEMFNPMALRKKPVDLDDDDDDEKDDDKLEEEKPKLSKRKLKKLSRMTVAELKQKVNRPELVEMHDVTAKDPVLLLHLKASRNTVPVPRHWCFKRKYLQGKRGIEKPAFELPDFIKRTGIMEMRQALQEKEDQKTMKAKMRERVRPKLGKIDIDYQKLHDAFFKWQTKPKMTIHGDLYYEGKEFETRLKEKKPGDLSEDLRTALGMPTGVNANKCPPPWLIAMQRYGPPPSYPNLKIPGLNAPIPESCSFGYHAGGWGKPPVDETGRPLYGDVFGTQVSDNQPHIPEEEIDHTLWGELESESSEEEDDEEEEDEEEEEEKTEDETGLVTPAEGLITPSGFSSIPAGMETPDMIELRKRKIEAEMEGGETPALYTILPEKKTERIGAAMMGSTHIYDIAAAIPGSKLKAPGTASVPPQGIEVALDPSELEMDSAAMAARYEQTMREQQSQLEKEDLSDMVAEHAARQKNKRKKQQLDSAKPPKKYKEFKF